MLTSAGLTLFVRCPELVAHPTAFHRSEDFLPKASGTFPDRSDENLHAGRMNVHVARPRSSAQPQARHIYRIRPPAFGSPMSGRPTLIALGPWRMQTNEVFPCAHSICRKQHTYSASILKSFGSAPKREQSPAPRSAGAGSLSKMILSSMSARSMLFLGKRCK